jgi:hypothetical protein
MRLLPEPTAVADDSVTPLDQLLAAADAEIVTHRFDEPKILAYAIERTDGHMAIVVDNRLHDWQQEAIARDLLARMREQRPVLAA